jgi:diguanylate cyclase (GGDEF)-like protein
MLERRYARCDPELTGRRAAVARRHVFSRRLFLAAAACIAVLIAIGLGASLLGLGGPDLEDTIHNIAEVAAGFFAGVVALIAALRSRGRRRVAWSCWSAYGFLGAVGEGIADWNTLVTHTALTFPSAADIAFLAQVPAGIVGAVVMMRASSSRLAVTVSLFDGFLVAGGLLVIGLSTFLDTFFEDGGNSIIVSVISLAEPVTDIVILTLVATLAVRVGRNVRLAPVLIAVGVAAVALADGAVTYQTAHGIDAPGSTFAIGWTAGLLFIGLGALYAACFRHQADFRFKSTARSGVGTLAPILLVALACGFASAEITKEPDFARTLVWAMLALMAVTLFRMCLAQLLNIRLGHTLAHQASHDALTGLPNRTLLRERLERALTARSMQPQRVTLLMLDLDGFKAVNDTFGHNAGDQLLIQVAERIVTSVRDVDLVARLGGDEFAALFASGPQDQAISIARRILAALDLPFTLGTATTSVEASIGIATGLSPDSADELLRHADLAMYAAKTSGGSRYALYEPQMHTAVAERTSMEIALRTAWLTNDLFSQFQPIVDLATGRMVSVEALARWKNSDHVVVPPSVFIPVAERTGAIIPIGIRMLNDACRCLAGWQRRHSEASELSVSVNLSPRQLHSEDLLDVVSEALRESGIHPSCLVLEVTETAVIEDMDSAIRILGRLKSLGIRLAMDDFGVGASSLARLRRLPLDIVKIDKSLVDHVPDGHVASKLLDAVVGVVNALRLRTVIEGVERVDQAEHLRAAGYDLGQGYYFGRPMSGDAIEALLASTPIGTGGISDHLIAAVEPSSSVDSPSERVLVVDDDVAIGTAACRILERQGMRATYASTIRKATTELTRGTDAMVVDIGMPDGDGWTLIGTVRADRLHASMPVVVMTGLLDDADVLNRAHDLKCEYLGKPFAPEALIAKVKLSKRLIADNLGGNQEPAVLVETVRH